jgi:hypothetical protein
MTGAEDLDRYGSWEQTPEYGPVWAPRAVAPDWAPYSAGHWAYVRPWGWTWVDAAPWGFAPFHYGRWVRYRSRWCWAPGTYVARPVYAPALVGWIGGSNVSVSISIGGGRSAPPVGWFPLAPREVYVPPYRYSPRYVRNINVTHVTNVTQITTIVNNTNGAADRRDFANRKFPHAVTVVPASVMTSRAPVAAEAARVRDDPQVRSLVANARPVAVTAAAPVAAPPPAPKPPSGKMAVTRPPIEGRPPGFAGRPGQERGERGQERGNERGQERNERGQPGSPPQGAAAQAAPVPAPGQAPAPAAAGRPGAPAVATRPDGSPAPRAEGPDGNRGRGSRQRCASGSAERGGLAERPAERCAATEPCAAAERCAATPGHRHSGRRPRSRPPRRRCRRAAAASGGRAAAAGERRYPGPGAWQRIARRRAPDRSNRRARRALSVAIRGAPSRAVPTRAVASRVPTSGR